MLDCLDRLFGRRLPGALSISAHVQYQTVEDVDVPSPNAGIEAPVFRVKTFSGSM